MTKLQIISYLVVAVMCAFFPPLLLLLIFLTAQESRNERVSKHYAAKPKSTLSTYVDLVEEQPDFTPTAPTGRFITAHHKALHLQSDYWHNLKQTRLAMANQACEHCGTMGNLHLHHISYANLGREGVEDVVILCATCHQAVHDAAEHLGDYKYDRKVDYPLSLLK